MFLDVCKTFDTVWIDGLMHNLLSELGVQGKMFSAIRSLYSDLQCYVYFNGTTTDRFPVTQGSGQGRVLAAFMYKVYINELIKEISECKFSLTINGLHLGCPTFADDMTLLEAFPSFLKNLMEKAFLHSKLWRCEYNEIKSGAVTFSETGPQHFVQKHQRSWTLGEKVVEEEDQYRNLGVVKSYAGSFQFDIDEAIEKMRKDAGMILNGCTDHNKTNPTIYVKLWKQVCLPSLLFGSELWIIG